MNVWKRFADAAAEEVEAARAADDADSLDRLRDALRNLERAIQLLESETQGARSASE